MVSAEHKADMSTRLCQQSLIEEGRGKRDKAILITERWHMD